MAIPSGLSAQFALVDETVYGTAVTVTRFYEFRGEGLKQDISRIESTALRSGQRVLRSDRWAAGKKSVGGDATFELANKSFGLLLKHMFGSVVTSQPASGTDPTVFDHTYTPGDLPVSLTGQVGRPDVGGVVRPFTYTGLRITDWELSCAVDEIATIKTTFVGQAEDTAIALAAASYPANLSLLTFVNGTLTVAGSATNVKSVSLKGNTGLADRYFLGSQLRSQPLENSLRKYDGKFDLEFENLTAYNRFVNGTEASVVLLFQGATISGTYKYQLQITANCRSTAKPRTLTARTSLACRCRSWSPTRARPASPPCTAPPTPRPDHGWCQSPRHRVVRGIRGEMPRGRFRRQGAAEGDPPSVEGRRRAGR
jgi:hypothetical protein